MAKKKKGEFFFVEPAPKPYVPRTPVSGRYKKDLTKTLESYWKDQCDYYGADDYEKPVHVEKRIQAVIGAVDLETADQAATKAKSVIEMHLLARWAAHRIPGPESYEACVKIAKKAESLAKFLESKDLDDQAATQYRRADEAWEKAKTIKNRIEIDNRNGLC
jgi:hypothetical protein